MWLAKARFLRTLPVPVLLNLFKAPLLVFILGMMNFAPQLESWNDGFRGNEKNYEEFFSLLFSLFQHSIIPWLNIKNSQKIPLRSIGCRNSVKLPTLAQ
jgi:hypothetical protein